MKAITELTEEDIINIIKEATNIMPDTTLARMEQTQDYISLIAYDAIAFSDSYSDAWNNIEFAITELKRVQKFLGEQADNE